ncbi:MAG: sodium:alanine symporter family protein [Oscillospiraceae bacterium]|nr:sodium:alanine symporter family protein [Oscillospiraceae bacterium]
MINVTFDEILEKIDGYVWGVPLIVLILSAGLLLTMRTGFIQVRHLPRALRLLFKEEKSEVEGEIKGEVSGFASLCTALSATIGTGNIVGVATAVGILAGGPGALFWMWIAAFFGMATKYSEGFLAVKYRTVDSDGHVLGGPFYYIENGMGKKWKWLAKVFAFFGACVGLMGIGTFSQVNGISSAVTGFFDPNGENTIMLFGNSYSVVTVISAFVLAICAGLVIIGGIKRISGVAEIIVPFMAILYIAAVLVLLIANITRIPAAVGDIIGGAFGIKPIAGGALASVMISMKSGVSRGIFSNESGLGSAPIAAAAAKTKEPVRQGLISMTGTFIDTIVICTMTGLSIVMMGSWSDASLEGVQVTTDAFSKGLYFLPSGAAAFILMLCLVFFAFTTILGWDYYGERCLEYLSGKNKTAVTVYRILYIAAVFIGPYMTVSAVWTIADIFNGLMALPNIVALFALSSVVARDTKDYFKRLGNGEITE